MMTQTTFDTDTFSSLLRRYMAELPMSGSLHKMRTKAWDHFLELGLPSRQTEVYRYIKLRQLFSHDYAIDDGKRVVDQKSIRPYIYHECAQSVLVFVNGCYKPELSNIQNIPPKVSIITLEEAVRTYGTFLNNFWTKSIKEESDPFASINLALHRDGAFIYVPPKTVMKSPLQILNIIVAPGQPLVLMPRITFFVGSQSEINVVSSQKVMEGENYLMNQVFEWAVEEDANVHFTKALSDEKVNAWHFDAIRANLKRNAVFKTINITQGSATSRADYRVNLLGENAEALLNGVCMLGGKREAHTNILMNHLAPHCRSYQLFKGVLTDSSRSSFEGKIWVDQIAQKTEAFQLNNNLILSDRAHADSKPNLEIFADDVKASHGATVGQLDEDQLFYMRARGIDALLAKNLLIHGFCEQVIEMVKIGSLRESISNDVRSYLKEGQNEELSA